jgi:hypothetical protein
MDMSFFVTPLNVNAHNVGVVKHEPDNTDISQNKEFFKGRGVQIIIVLLCKCF